jgi:hypothetical protein
MSQHITVTITQFFKTGGTRFLIDVQETGNRPTYYRFDVPSDRYTREVIAANEDNPQYMIDLLYHYKQHGAKPNWAKEGF